MDDLDLQIKEFLNERDWVTSEEIAQSIGADPSVIEQRLEQLRGQGMIDFYRSGYPLKWGIKEEGQKFIDGF